MRAMIFILIWLLAVPAFVPAVAGDEGWVAKRIEQAMSDYEAGNYRAARVEFQRAADHGSAIAETMLGSMYASGTGVPVHNAVAAGYFYRAANRGYGPAQLALSDVYASGRGVRVSAHQAFFWATLALEADNVDIVEKARGRLAALSSRLLPGDIQKLREEAEEWRPRARRFR